MDGENNGSKPYEQMGWFGGGGKTHPDFWVYTHCAMVKSRYTGDGHPTF